MPTSKANEIGCKMYGFYKMRSDFVHGGKSTITDKDEFDLREYVRKFLLLYYLYWKEMHVKSEQQMLQKLDEIYRDHSYYRKYAPASYSFMI